MYLGTQVRTHTVSPEMSNEDIYQSLVLDLIVPCSSGMEFPTSFRDWLFRLPRLLRLAPLSRPSR